MFAGGVEPHFGPAFLNQFQINARWPGTSGCRQRPALRSSPGFSKSAQHAAVFATDPACRMDACMFEDCINTIFGVQTVRHHVELAALDCPESGQYRWPV